MKAEIRSLLRAMVRRLAPVPAASAAALMEPVSRVFGLDRGTPIDRHYIAAFLEANREHIRGIGLEVAEPAYTTRYKARLSGIEILHVSPEAKGATIVGDLAKPETLREGVADTFICTQTLPFIFDVAGAVRGAHRLLRPGGTLLATVSGISQISRYDMDRWGDYWRFTQKSARMVMEHAFAPEDIHVEAYGNVCTAKAFLDGMTVEDLADRAVLEHHDADYPVTIGIRAKKRA